MHSVEHAKGSIDTGLSGFPIPANNAKLRIATAQEEASSAPRSITLLIAIIIAHMEASPSVAVTIPTVAAFPPTSITIIIAIARRTLAPRGCGSHNKSSSQYESFAHNNLLVLGKDAMELNRAQCSWFRIKSLKLSIVTLRRYTEIIVVTSHTSGMLIAAKITIETNEGMPSGGLHYDSFVTEL